MNQGEGKHEMSDYTVIFRDDRYNVIGAISILHTTGKEQAYARAMSDMHLCTAGAQIIPTDYSLNRTPEVFS
jgi:hypothetical protein